MTNKRNRDLIGALIILLIFGVFLVYGRITSPDQGLIKGVYRNECCRDFIFSKGYVTHGDDRFGIELENMKFGLTACTEADFSREGGQISSESTGMTFYMKDGRRAFDLIIDGSEYTFVATDNLVIPLNLEKKSMREFFP